MIHNQVGNELAQLTIWRSSRRLRAQTMSEALRGLSNARFSVLKVILTLVMPARDVGGSIRLTAEFLSVTPCLAIRWPSS